MTREEALNILHNASVYHPDYLDALNMAIEALEQEPCDDEYIKVPKKALKYRTAGMVAYNVEWLKNHFDIEQAVICGAQEPCTDAISRQAAIVALDNRMSSLENVDMQIAMGFAKGIIHGLSPATLAEKVGKWIPVSERLPNFAGAYLVTRYFPNNVMNPTYLVDACFFDGTDTWHNDNRINHERKYLTNVVAWLEEPEPYKASPTGEVEVEE